jgi:hypothetical protein
MEAAAATADTDAAAAIEEENEEEVVGTLQGKQQKKWAATLTRAQRLAPRAAPRAGPGLRYSSSTTTSPSPLALRPPPGYLPSPPPRAVLRRLNALCPSFPPGYFPSLPPSLLLLLKLQSSCAVADEP